jgi:hypothetical protein
MSFFVLFATKMICAPFYFIEKIHFLYGGVGHLNQHERRKFEDYGDIKS